MSIERFQHRKRQEEEHRPGTTPENPYDRLHRVPDRTVPIDDDNDATEEKSDVS